MKRAKRFVYLMRTYRISPVTALAIIFVHDPAIAREEAKAHEPRLK